MASISMAKPRFSASGMPAELMPTTWPAAFRSGPPELPWLMAASVWIRFFSVVWPSSQRAALGRHDAGGDGRGVTEGQRVADGHDLVTDLHGVRGPQGRRHQLGGVAQADEGDVVARRGADEVGADRALVAQLDLDDVGAVDDVRVGEHQPVGGDDDARAGGERDHLVAAGLAELDRHDRRRDLLEEGPQVEGLTAQCLRGRLDRSGPDRGRALRADRGPPRSRRHRPPPRPRGLRRGRRGRRGGTARRAVSTAAGPPAVGAGSFPRRGLTPRRSWPSCALRGCIGHPSGN